MPKKSYTDGKCRKQLDGTWTCELFTESQFVPEPATKSITLKTPFGDVKVPAAEIDSYKIVKDEDRAKVTIEDIADVSFYGCHSVFADKEEITVQPSIHKVMTKSITPADKRKKHLYIRCSDPLRII